MNGINGRPTLPVTDPSNPFDLALMECLYTVGNVSQNDVSVVVLTMRHAAGTFPFTLGKDQAIELGGMLRTSAKAISGLITPPSPGGLILPGGQG